MMDLLQTFESLRISKLEGFIRSKQPETLYLDFKAASRADMSAGDDRKTLAKAISGFANSAGGLIIWGIDARKNSEGIDCAQAPKEIDNVRLFVSRLNELSGDAVSPRVDGVQHREVVRKTGAGFAVTMIPESDIGPHMAKYGEDRYYKRSGSSFYRMEHFDIADMFGRRRKPKLVLVTRTTSSGNGPEVVLALRNEGRAVASAPFFAFKSEGPLKPAFYGLDGNRREGMRRQLFTGDELPYRFSEDTSFVIHPGVTIEITKLTLPVSPPQIRGLHEVRLEYAICAENMPLERSSYILHLDVR